MYPVPPCLFIRPEKTEGTVTVPYGGTHQVAISAKPVQAAAFSRVSISSLSPDIARLQTREVTFDAEGKAYITVSGLLPGTTFLTYSIDDLQLSDVDTVRVVSQLGYVPVPQASLISGTYVSQGTQVVLTAQEGCTIWYTLDGSCPCDEARRQRYTGPISITANTTLRAMAVTADGRESEVVTFTWFISTAIANVQQPERNAARSYDLQGRSRQARAVVPRQVMIVDGRKVLRP